MPEVPEAGVTAVPTPFAVVLALALANGCELDGAEPPDGIEAAGCELDISTLIAGTCGARLFLRRRISPTRSRDRLGLDCCLLGHLLSWRITHNGTLHDPRFEHSPISKRHFFIRATMCACRIWARC